MAELKEAISTKHKGMIVSQSVNICEKIPFYRLYGRLMEKSVRYILPYLHLHLASAFKDTNNRDFIRSIANSAKFSLLFKISLLKPYPPIKQVFKIMEFITAYLFMSRDLKVAGGLRLSC